MCNSIIINQSSLAPVVWSSYLLLQVDSQTELCVKGGVIDISPAKLMCKFVWRERKLRFFYLDSPNLDIYLLLCIAYSLH